MDFIYRVRKLVSTLKEGDNELSIRLRNIYPKEGEEVKDQILKHSAKQSYFTVGGTFDYDFIIPQSANTVGG